MTTHLMYFKLSIFRYTGYNQREKKIHEISISKNKKKRTADCTLEITLSFTASSDKSSDKSIMNVTVNLNKKEGDLGVVAVQVTGEDVVVCCALIDVVEICDLGVCCVVVDGLSIVVVVEGINDEALAVVNAVLQGFLYSVVVGSCEGVMIAGPL